jgi:hypothetical protein
MAFKIVGGLFIAFGVVDLLGSFLGWDVWGGWFGLELPELLWRFSAWIEIGIGLLILRFGQDTDPAAN